MKHKAHVYFWIAAALLILLGGVARLVLGSDNTLDINIHDTYYIVDYWYIILFLVFVYLLLGIAYWCFYKAQIALQKKLTKVHAVITVLIVPAYCILLAYCNYIVTDPMDILTGKNYELLSKGVLIIVLTGLLVQLLFLLNIIISLIKRQKA
jgi:heme/copper-type cytochrome/quinol oxidase subunit 1